MSKTLQYRGYRGSIEYSLEDNLLFGKVIGIRSLLSYEGTTLDELAKDFHETVDWYLASCEEEGTAPEKPFLGSFNVRIPQPLHERLALYAREHEKTLNSCVTEAIERYMAEPALA